MVTLNLSDSAGVDIGVSRDYLRVSPPVRDEISLFVRQKLSEVETEFLAKYEGSLYAWLNARILAREIPPNTPLNWGTLKSSATLQWTCPVPPYFVPDEDYRGQAMLGKKSGSTEEAVSPDAVVLNGKHVAFCATLDLRRGDEDYHGMKLDPFDAPPEIVIEGIGRSVLVPGWRQPMRKQSSPKVARVEFPPNWNAFLGMYPSDAVRQHVLLNAGHVLAGLSAETQFGWTTSVLARPSYDRTRKSVFPDENLRVRLLQEPTQGMDWLVACAVSGAIVKTWEVLNQQDPSFLPRLWDCFGLAQSQEIYFYTQGKFVFGPTVVRITPEKASGVSLGLTQINKIVGEPLPNWSLAQETRTES